LTRLRAVRFVIANGAHFVRWAKRSSVMSKLSKAASKSKAASPSNAAQASRSPSASVSTSNVLLIEVPPPFIALCEDNGVTPQSALRGMAAMLCGLRYDDDNRLVPLEDAGHASAV
jgi:hypothetical protein